MERIILIITSLIAVSSGIQAQDSLDSLMNRDLDEVVVTAQRKYTKPTARGLKVSSPVILSQRLAVPQTQLCRCRLSTVLQVLYLFSGKELL